jgi:hypothetical protein
MTLRQPTEATNLYQEIIDLSWTPHPIVSGGRFLRGGSSNCPIKAVVFEDFLKR